MCTHHPQFWFVFFICLILLNTTACNFEASQIQKTAKNNLTAIQNERCIILLWHLKCMLVILIGCCLIQPHMLNFNTYGLSMNMCIQAWYISSFDWNSMFDTTKQDQNLWIPKPHSSTITHDDQHLLFHFYT